MNQILIGKGETPVYLLSQYGNRHGLVAGATGTGKTVSLMVIAEGFSRMGVPVFLGDVKGDVAGLSMAGTPSEKITKRAAEVGVDGFVAEANPKAGYTRHPTAFLPNGPAFEWPSYIGFMGPLNRLSGDKPASADEDVYQVQRIPGDPAAESPLSEFVVWDCPDMTTWASLTYVNRLLEVAALADVIVYVASDERYNDEVPTQFLHLLIKAGKAVVVVLTKVREENAATLTDHFRREVLGRLPKLPDGSTPAVPVIAFPQMPQAERTDPAGAGAKHRVNLLNQILMLCESDVSVRLRTVTNAAKYLATAGEGLLDVARRDLAEFDAWKTTVMAGKVEFEDRYRKEFLSGEQFRRFDRYRDELMDQLELPGAGRMLTGFIWLARMPYRWTRNYVAGLMTRPEVYNLSEQTVLTASLAGWLDKLQAEALRRAGTHPVWKQIAVRFDSELAPQARERFAHEFRAFELKETDELERTGKALVDGLEKNPTLLYGLRGGKFAVDLLVIGGVLYITWPPGWSLLLIPLGVRDAPGDGTGRARGGREGPHAGAEPARRPRVGRAHCPAGRMGGAVARDGRLGHREAAGGSPPRARVDPPVGRARPREGRRVASRLPRPAARAARHHPTTHPRTPGPECE